MPKKHADQVGEYAEFAARIEAALTRILKEPGVKYSIQDKATALGFSKSFMRDILDGEKLPSAANIMEIAKRTGVRAEWLWTGNPPMVEKLAEGYLFIGDLTTGQQDAIKAVKEGFNK